MLGGQGDSELVNKNLQGNVNFLKDWYDPGIMKASLCDITSTEAGSKRANAIIAVQDQSGVDCRWDEGNNPKFIKSGVTKEFEQAFQLLKETELPVCFIRGVPHYDEGYAAQVAQHYIFLYFFYNDENKKSVLIVDPQGSKFGDRFTADGNRAIDNEAIHTIGEAVEENNVKIYVSQDVIQQDAYSCGPVSVELARIFYEVSDDKGRKEALFKVLSKSKEMQAKCDDNSGYILQYQVCTLGERIIPKEVVEDFDQKVKYKNEEVGGQSIRRIHYDLTVLIDGEGIKKIKGGEGNYADSVEPFLHKLVSIVHSENLCPSFKSGIITGTPLLNPKQIEQAEQNRREKLGKLTESLQPETSRSVVSLPPKPMAHEQQAKKPNACEEKAPSVNIPTLQTKNGDQKNNNHTQQKTPIPQTMPKHNNIYVYSTLGGAIVGAAIAYFAGAATLASLGVAIAVFIASAVVGASVGYGIAQVCKKVSEKEERGSNVDSELLSTFVERSNQQQL